MADLENRFKGFITPEMLEARLTEEGGKKPDNSNWRPSVEKTKSNKVKTKVKSYHPGIFLIIMVVFTVIVLGGGYLYLNQSPKRNDDAKLNEAASGGSNTPVPTSTTVPTLSKDQVQVLILNGTGIKGQAGKVQVSLEELGYKLIDVEISKDESETTTIEYKPGALTAEDIAAIKTLLEKTYHKVIELKSSEAKVDLKITTGSLKSRP